MNFPSKPRRRTILSVVFLCCTSAGYGQTGESSELAQAAAAPTVSVTIDYGDGSQKRFPKIAWPAAKEHTVADAMAFAERHARGITIIARGEGETRFLEAIDGLKNEGAGGNNWMILINGELAKSSYATASVQPGSDILWEFRAFQ